MRILIVEDKKDMAATLADGLKDVFIVENAYTGKEAIEMVKNAEYDLIILDLGLPDTTGDRICQAVRTAGIVTPILILTGQFEVQDKVTALDAGADDYLTKPFNFAELQARIRALLRRNPHSITPEKLTAQDVILDTATRTVTRSGREVYLRRKEYEILEYLMRNQKHIVTRTMILRHVWGTNNDLPPNTVDVQIKNLRDQIDHPDSPKLIQTVYGLGYRIAS